MNNKSCSKYNKRKVTINIYDKCNNINSFLPYLKSYESSVKINKY